MPGSETPAQGLAPLPEPQWLEIEAAIIHCTAGIGICGWASNDQGSEPDVVMACAGDVPTLETLAAVDLLRRLEPDLKVRVVNVVDLMRLQPSEEHPHGLSNGEFDALFTTDKLIEHKEYIVREGQDMPEIRDWQWSDPQPESARNG